MDKITKIRFRQDSHTNFSNANPLLEAGEPAFEIDTGILKVGDGSTRYNELPAINGGAAPMMARAFVSQETEDNHLEERLDYEVENMSAKIASLESYISDLENKLCLLQEQPIQNVVEQFIENDEEEQIEIAEVDTPVEELDNIFEDIVDDMLSGKSQIEEESEQPVKIEIAENNVDEEIVEQEIVEQETVEETESREPVKPIL